MKRPQTRTKTLFLIAPLLAVAIVGGVLWSRNQTASIESIDQNEKDKHIAYSESPDGKRLAKLILSERNKTVTLQIYDRQTHQKIVDLETPPPMSPFGKPYRESEDFFRPSGLFWSPDSKRIVTAYSDGLTGKTKIPIPTPKGKAPQFRPNFIDKIAVWDANSGAVIGNYYAAPIEEDSQLKVAVFSKNNKHLLASGSRYAKYDAATGKRLIVYKGNIANPSETSVNMKAGFAAELSSDRKRLVVFSARSRKNVLELKGSSFQKFDWRADILVILGIIDGEQKIKFWDSKSQKFHPSPSFPPESGIVKYRFNRKQKSLVIHYVILRPNDSHSENWFMEWDLEKHQVLWKQSVPESILTFLLSPDGKRIAAMTASKNDDRIKLRILGPNENRIIHRNLKYSFNWTNDGKSILIASQDGRFEYIAVSK